MRTLPAAALSLGALSSCTRASETLFDEANAIPEVDLSHLTEIPELAALVPEDVRARGELVNGAELSYAPMEFQGPGGEPVGMDLDILAAIGAVLGLSTRTEVAQFARIIPSVGSSYDIGMSAFTINEERLREVHMVSYFQAGISYAVKTGNPYGVVWDDACGTKIALQVGTYMEELARERSSACIDAGDDAADVLPFATSSEASVTVAGGKADIFMADSPVTAYAIAQSRGTLEAIGEVEESALNGIVVSKDNPELAEAICAALQHLIDTGELDAILAAWGNESGRIDTAEVDPLP